MLKGRRLEEAMQYFDEYLKVGFTPYDENACEDEYEINLDHGASDLSALDLQNGAIVLTKYSQ
jgi:hypothetical protein